MTPVELPTSWLGLAAVFIIVTGYVLVSVLLNRQRRIKSDMADTKSDMADTKSDSAATRHQLQNGQTTNFRQEFDAANRRQEARLAELIGLVSEVRGDVRSIHTRVERLESHRKPWWQSW